MKRILMLILLVAVSMVSYGQVATGTDAPAAGIPDNGYDGTLGSMASSAIAVAGAPSGSVITDITLDIDIAHTWVGDLTIKLEAPNGDILGVMSRPGLVEGADDGTGCCGTSDDWTTSISFNDAFALSAEDFDDDAIPLPVQYSPAPGSVTNPPATFADLFGSDVTGNWTLYVGDSGGGDAGTLNSWTITINYDAPAPGGPSCSLSCPTAKDYYLGSGECSVLADYQGAVTMVGSCAPTVVPGAQAADFTGPFAEANAATQNTGCVDFTGNPATLTMSSNDLTTTCDPGLFFATYSEYAIPFDGTLTFDWSYTTADLSATFDPFGYFFDASTTVLSPGAITAGITTLTQNGVAAQSGSGSVSVSAGDLFSFMIWTTDGQFGPGTVTISNLVLQAPNDVQPYVIQAQAGSPALGDELAIGTYTAGYDLLNPNGTVAQSCTFDVTVHANAAATNNPGCVQNIQFSLDENCEITLTPGMVLKSGGSYSCFDNYVVDIKDGTGASLGNVANGGMVGNTWTVMVTDTTTGNSCWSQGITFADKMAPTINCDVTAPVNSITGTIDPSDPIWNRPFVNFAGTCNPSGVGTTVSYETFDFSITQADTYTFSMPNIIGPDFFAALYEGGFDPTQPCNNLLAADDDTNGTEPEITISLTLAPGNYTLVTTTYNTDPNAGAYAYTVSSLGNGQVITTGSELSVDCTFDLSTVADPIGSDNCDPNPTVSMTGETYINQDICDDGKMVLQRTWVAYDNNGMASAPCTQTITITQPQITFPQDITWTCDQYASNNNIIDTSNVHSAITDWDTGDNQNDIDVNPAMSNFVLNHTGSGNPKGWNGTYCKYNVEYTDQTFQHCGPGTFKIIRHWTAINLCTNDIQTADQIILVDDIEAPTMDFTNLGAFKTNAAGDLYLELSANNYAQHPTPCTSTEFIPTPAFADNCSGVDMSTLSIITPVGPVDGLTANGGTIPAPGLAVGVYTDGLTYKIVDNCGNIREMKITLVIVDDVPPVMICDQITKVSLTSNGEAKLFANNPDDGSYDNCGLDHFEIRRMTDNCNIAGNTTFGADVTFCCNDITTGTTNSHTVIVRAYDVYGNHAECMVEVLVEDKIAPKCFAPADVTVDCNLYDPSFEPYGDATAWDNCGATLTGPVIGGGVDQCNTGVVTRTWTATDAAGQSSTCKQTITVNYVQDFRVKFPDDQFSTACNALSDTIFPSFIDKDCELAGYSYYDQKITVVPDACYKILRHWTVMDWCVFDSYDVGGGTIAATHVDNPTYTQSGPTRQANATNSGYFTYIQIIKVIDNDAPVITCPTSPVEVCDYSTNCSGIVDLTSEATDDCSGDNIIFGYTLYLDNDQDGIMETVIDDDTPGAPYITITHPDGIKAVANIHMSGITYGTHKIKWFAKDGCGNIDLCEYDFIVKDCKKPTILVDGGITVNLMNVNGGMITIWPGDPANCNLPQPNVCGWDPSLGDNCTSDADLKAKLRIRKAGSGTGVPTTTSVTYTCADLGTQNVEIWVGDNAGNWDFVVTSVLVQDPMNFCNPTPTAPIAGALTTQAGAGVQDADVTSTNGVTPSTITTPASGEFTFTGLPLSDDYSITAAKDGDDANGVDVLDLLRIYQAILGNNFTSPYDKIAADVNLDGSVDIQDLLLIRKLTLGKITEFPGTDSWRFYDAACTISGPTSCGSVEVIDLQAAVNNADLVAVKMGDVNGSAQPNQYASVDDRSYGEFVLNTSDRMINAGETVEVTLNANRNDIAGYQFTLELGGLEFVDVAGEAISFENNFAYHNDAVTVSWNGEAVNDEVFTITLRATTDVRLSEALSIDSRITEAMAADADALRQDVKLAFDGKVVDQFTLFQNEPNPFSDRTDVKFYLPEGTSATLTVFDASGRTLKTVNGDYAKGMNTISVAKSDLQAVGVLYYKLETASNSAIRKMIIIE